MLKYQELQYRDAKKYILPLNSKLCKIIDAISPNKSYTFYKISYRFGDKILQNSKLHLPTEKNTLFSLEDHQVTQKLKEDLGYNGEHNPVGLLTKGAVELFLQLNDRTVPFAIVRPGRVFGTWRILDTGPSYAPKTFPWGMTAGARNIFMLPKISEAGAHHQLIKKFQLNSEKPEHPRQHWKIFTELARHSEFGAEWEVEFLFFSKKWFETLHDKAWEKFKLYLLDNAWQASGYWRNEFIWNFVFSMMQKSRNLKLPAYIIHIVKHLWIIAVNALPGFRPALNDSLAPISKLQSIYMEYYKLKKYLPIIMQPEYFSNSASPIYYSLQYPTTMESTPKSSTRNSTLTDLLLVHSSLRKFLEEIIDKKLGITDIFLRGVLDKVNFDFFHHNVGAYRSLNESSQIPLEDKTFFSAYKNPEDRLFPKNSTFFNGCVRISHK